MIKEAIATGATVDEARTAAINELGEIGSDTDIQFEIIDLPQKKTFGLFGGCPAKVRVFVELPEAKEPIKTVEKYKRLDKGPKNTPPSREGKTSQPAKKAEKAEKDENEIQTESGNSPEGAKLAPFTDEAKKAAADKGMAYLKTLLNCMGIEADLKSGETESGALITIEGKNLGTIVGRRGETLDALQYLTVLAANHGVDGYYRITLNTGNYREKREKTLQALARKMANQSIRNGRNVALEPMNPFERRIIHTAVQDIRGVTSWSVGEEPFRRVIIGSGKDKNYRGGRGGYRRDKDRNTDSSKVQNYSAPAAEREQKKDFDSAPLYGKIEK